MGDLKISIVAYCYASPIVIYVGWHRKTFILLWYNIFYIYEDACKDAKIL
jgi:hypothetical protein